MIVAGEASGDLHGANLVRAMQARDPALRFCGMGGTELQQAGVELLYDAAKLAVVGAIEVLSHLGDILRARRALIERMQQASPCPADPYRLPGFQPAAGGQGQEARHPDFLLHQSPDLGLAQRPGPLPSSG